MYIHVLMRDEKEGRMKQATLMSTPHTPLYNYTCSSIIYNIIHMYCYSIYSVHSLCVVVVVHI